MDTITRIICYALQIVYAGEILINCVYESPVYRTWRLMVHVGYVLATFNLCIIEWDYVPEKTNYKYYFSYIAMTYLH